MSDYVERQREWLNDLGLDAGSIEGKKFKVARAAASREDGWRNYWNDTSEESMDDAVGRTFKATGQGLLGYGIRLNCPGNDGGYYFPFFVLEPAWKPELGHDMGVV